MWHKRDMETCSLSRTATNWKEGRRLRAFELAGLGWKQRAIAHALGVTEGAVSQWMKKARQQGAPEALRHKKSSGRPRRLSLEQQQQLPALLEQGPGAFGLTGEVWTCKRVALVLRRQFGVSFSPRQMGRILDDIGFSRQKPQKKAAQRDEAAIKAWSEQKWPQLKRGQPRSEGPSSS